MGEVIVVLIVILIAWAFISSAGRKNDRHPPRQEKKQDAVTEADRVWQQTRLRHEAEMPERRTRVLAALRSGQLNQKQIAIVLETSSQFGFSAVEIEELKAAIRAPAGTRKNDVCRVCGKPAIPGEDLCFSHHAK